MEPQEPINSPANPVAQPVPPAPAAPSNPLAPGGVGMLVLALLLLACGLCACVFYVTLPLLARQTPDLQSNVIFGSAAGFGFLFSALLAWQGLVTVRGRESVQAARVFPPIPALILAFIGAVLLGLAALALGPAALYAFPPLHFIAASLAPVAILAYGARRLGRRSGLRALVVSLCWGALGATALAFIFEIFVAMVLIAGALLVVASRPDGTAILEQVQAQLRVVQNTGDLASLEQWMTNPWVLLTLLVYLAGIVPFLEESVKALVVAFVDPRRTRAADAVLWGMAAGAGFAIIENIFNASVSLTEWAPLILLRVGAAVVHIANGANMGRGWYAARVERRWSKLFLAYGTCVVYHALWNATAITLSYGGSESFAVLPTAGSLLGVLALVVLVILAGLGLIGIIRLVRANGPDVTPAT